MKWYPWLTPVYQQLIANYLSTRPHHALLIHLRAGMGQKQLINALARRIMCAQGQGNKSCGVCHHCSLMEAETHPDFHHISVENGKTTIGVEQIRQLSYQLYEHAQQGGAKVIWLQQAELMTEAAANALLKTLEEPTTKTYFILTSYDSARLLATIRSRCMAYNFSVIDQRLSLSWLKSQTQQSDENIQIALSLKQGAPLAALTLLSEPLWQQRSELCHHLLTGNWIELLPLLTNEQAEQGLYWVSSLMMDALKQQQGLGQFIVNRDQHRLIMTLAARWSEHHQLHYLIELWRDYRYKLLSIAGINKELLLADLLYKTENY